jgi:predicted HTH transcriptional regulator
MKLNMDYQEIIFDLCARQDEEEWFEFKENWFEPNQLGEYISAISNVAAVFGKENGYMVWGINDVTHEIVGTNFNFNKSINNEPLENYLARLLKPSIAFEFKEVIINGLRVVLLIIPAAKRIPTSFDKERYYRIGSSKVSLENYPEREALVWKVLSEGYPTMINTESPIQDLTFDKLRLYFIDHDLQFNDNFQTNLKLLTKDGKYNMLGCYLADNGNIPVRVALFSGNSKAEKLYSVKEFGNESLISVIDRIIDYSTFINIPRAIEHLNTGFREDVYLFDQECFNEAVKNAFIHNNWTHRASPMIAFFDNRVEITSFSSLAPNQS